MRFLAISDLHGDLASAWAAVETARPDVLLCCGDWGDPDEIDPADLHAFSDRLPVYTVFGNHDHLEALADWRNTDGSSVLLETGVARDCGGVTLAGLNGIWAKSHRKPYYVTDEELDEATLKIAGSARRVDILLSHGCPSGVADLTWDNRHGGQRCFLRAFQALRPTVYLTGHLHRAQEHVTRDRQFVRNVGQTPEGQAVLIDWLETGVEVTALNFTP